MSVTISFERTAEFTERRHHARAALGVAIALRERGRIAMVARLVDFSALGCRIEGLVARPSNDAQVWVKLPGLESLSARRIWSQDALTGVEFDCPLHPAVAATFMPPAGSPASQPLGFANDEPGPLRSRREQIMAGIAGSQHSPLQRHKRPSGLGLMGRIGRSVTRSTDHRAELRYADAVPAGTALTIGGEAMQVLNVSPSGIKITGLPGEHAIGATLYLTFDGFPAMIGELVWLNGTEAGFALPQHAIELFDRA